MMPALRASSRKYIRIQYVSISDRVTLHCPPNHPPRRAKRAREVRLPHHDSIPWILPILVRKYHLDMFHSSLVLNHLAQEPVHPRQVRLDRRGYLRPPWGPADPLVTRPVLWYTRDTTVSMPHIFQSGSECARTSCRHSMLQYVGV